MAGVPRTPPRYVPTLTEVVQPAAAQDGAATSLEQLQEQVIHRVMQRVDLSLERRLREAIATLRAFIKPLRAMGHQSDAIDAAPDLMARIDAYLAQQSALDDTRDKNDDKSNPGQQQKEMADDSDISETADETEMGEYGDDEFGEPTDGETPDNGHPL